MKVPKGKTVYSGKHKYKAGAELPAHLAEKLDKKPAGFKSSNKPVVDMPKRDI